jgi:hypothetical protein
VLLHADVALSGQVDKIFGPGNQYVTAAKMLLTNSEAMISIDMPAGPSEVLVIAGEAGQQQQQQQQQRDCCLRLGIIHMM